MPLDDLQQKWAEYDGKIEASLRLNRLLLATSRLDQTRSALHRLIWATGLGAAINLIAVAALGSFAFEHRTELRFIVPAMLVDAFAILLLSGQIRQIALAARIDYSGPVAAIQKQLETLRILRIRYVQGIFLFATLLWVPLLIVAGKGLFGVDLYRCVASAWIAANVALGIALIPLGVWLSKTYGDRLNRSSWAQQFLRDLSGRSLNAAAGFLATIEDFEGGKA